MSEPKLKKKNFKSEWNEFSCIHPIVKSALLNQGFSQPTPIQRAVLGSYGSHNNWLIAAQTGSGKTLSFAIPIVSQLLKLSSQSQDPLPLLAVVVSPTRQLAQQTAGVMTSLGCSTQLIVGGFSRQKQLRILKQQPPLAIVGTPGRLHQLLTFNFISFAHIRFLVIDEADRMIELGHFRQVDTLLSAIFHKPQNSCQQEAMSFKFSQQVQKSSQFYIKTQGKRKLQFDVHSLPTDKLIETPLSMLIALGLATAPVNQQKNLKQMQQEGNIQQNQQEIEEINNNDSDQNKPNQNLTEEQLTLIQGISRKSFFLSATLTRAFKDTKYFIKRGQQRKSKTQLKKQKKIQKMNRNQEGLGSYIPKLKALLSRVNFQEEPHIVDLSKQVFMPPTLIQRYAVVDEEKQKMTAVVGYLKTLQRLQSITDQQPQIKEKQLTKSFESIRVLIFGNTIRSCKRIHFLLSQFGFEPKLLHSHLQQRQRLKTLQDFDNEKRLSILVSTDVAARGLDLIVTHVIQLGIPVNGDTYVHRVGRTARANRQGQSFLVLQTNQSPRWEDIRESIGNPPLKRISSVTWQPFISEVAKKEWLRLNQPKSIDKKQHRLAQQLQIQLEAVPVTEEQRIRGQILNRQVKALRKKIQKKQNLQTRPNKLFLSPLELHRLYSQAQS